MDKVPIRGPMQLTELLEEVGVDYRLVGQHHHATRNWVSIDCPFCSPQSGKFRLGVNLQWGNCSCWTCGTHKLYEVLREGTTISLDRLAELLKEFRSSSYSRSSFSLFASRGKAKGKLKLPLGLGPFLPVHRKYLVGRGFDPQGLVRLWKLQGIGLHAKYPWSIFIPVCFRGEVVSFTTRSIGGRGFRYRAASKEEESFPSKELLFGEDYVRETIIVCEGPFDVFRIGPGAVATLGVSYTSEQIARIGKYPVRIVCFDPDEEGQRRAAQLISELSPYYGQTLNVVLETGEDPASASKEEIQELRNKWLGSSHTLTV